MKSNFKRVRFEEIPNARCEEIYEGETITLSKDIYFKLYCMAELAEKMMCQVDDYLDEQLEPK